MTKPANQTVEAFLSALAARSSTPGGGSAAAITGAEGAALLAMVCNFTRGTADTDTKKQCLESQERFLELSTQDITAFDNVMAHYKAPDSEAFQLAVQEAISVSLNIMGEACKLVPVAEHLMCMGNKNLITDVAIGAILLKSAIDSAHANVLINCQSSNDPREVKAIAKNFTLVGAKFTEVYNNIRDSL